MPKAMKEQFTIEPLLNGRQQFSYAVRFNPAINLGEAESTIGKMKAAPDMYEALKDGSKQIKPLLELLSEYEAAQDLPAWETEIKMQAALNKAQ